MKYTQPIYIAFFTIAFISLLVALFFEKQDLLYVYPFTFIAIAIAYVMERKKRISITFLSALFFGLCGGIFLILDFKEAIPMISICISIFYLLYLRLMYLKNERKKAHGKTYVSLLFIFIPVLYIYDRVFCLVYEEIHNGFVYFTVMAVCMLVYIMAAIYYYLRTKNQSNLWMLITAVNLGIMNIIVIINELYVYERIFTVMAIFCSNLMLFFSIKFMLEEDTNVLTEVV
ncbi:hypothetical protein KORDIASMS9_03214 [Kordia sp. SMS9]|uniref:hypothetical protein n=1 Tax=Kordia sp. SMS9 TaxID=2282170 RepID=UPI000E0DA45B|nr:hypothetical protein [Kordia sp. SMS9]AXG70959.1 hypothetical protein KORDIASMS9_03214 [Kordia sp. SMS9]